jgi:formylmethanofuran dehydrogenase subunit B
MSAFRGICSVCGCMCWGKLLTKEEQMRTYVCQECQRKAAEQLREKTREELIEENTRLRATLAGMKESQEA